MARRVEDDAYLCQRRWETGLIKDRAALSKVVADIGEKAKDSAEEGKTATAKHFRSSFVTRWSIRHLRSTEGGTRTLTPLRELDFESSASANSATSAWAFIGANAGQGCRLFNTNPLRASGDRFLPRVFDRLAPQKCSSGVPVG